MNLERGKCGNKIAHITNKHCTAVIVTNYEINEIFNKPLK